MKTWYKFFPVLALSVFSFSTYAMAAPIELSFQNTYAPMQKQTVEVIEPWANLFKEKSNGDLSVNYYGMAAIVETSELSHAVANGMLDMANWSTYFPKEVPYLYLLGLPYLAKSVTHSQLVLEKMIESVPEVKQDVEKAGVFLTVHGGAPLSLASKTPIKSPADLKGKRVLIPMGAMAEIIEAWGGVPVLVAPGDVYVGLQRGLGEVYFSGISNVRGLKLGEVVKYVTLVGIPMGNTMIYSINKDIYEEMSDSQKQLLHELTDNLGQEICNSFKEDTSESIAALEKDGATVFELTESEMEPFIELVKKTSTNWAKRGAEYGVKNVDEVIKRYYELAESIPDPGDDL